jgi:hypothetical protein
MATTNSIPTDRRFTAGGHARKGNRTSEYRTWQKMNQRCYYSKQRGYHLYGGRGITVCDRWRHSFLAFLVDMGPKPCPSASIDRIDNDGNYEPANCRWASAMEQMVNSRRARAISHGGETHSIRGWARRLGVTHPTISSRLSQGWSMAQIVSHYST